MFKAARLEKIKEIILRNGEATVLALSNLLEVSSVTIRSDLEELEQEGFLQRTHGGAILTNTSPLQNQNIHTLGEDSFSDEEKRQIAVIAAQLIQENEWIFLGPGMTCYYLAAQLLDKHNINIITNNLRIPSLLSQNASAHIYFTGGEANRSGLFTYGEMFERTLSGIYFTKAFFSAEGVDFNGGYTVNNMNLLHIYRCVKEISKEVIAVVDAGKFNNCSFVKMSGLHDIHTVISNQTMPDSYKEYYFKNNILLFTSYDLKNDFME